MSLIKWQTKLFPLYLVLFLICFAITFISAALIFVSLSELAIKRNGQRVTAEIVGISVSTGSSTAGFDYDLKYYFKDENGIEYNGFCGRNIRDEESARAYIGTMVEIYIDGKGGSVYVGRLNDKAPIIAGIFAAVFLGATGIIFYFGILPLLRGERPSAY